MLKTICNYQEFSFAAYEEEEAEHLNEEAVAKIFAYYDDYE